jgi:hypothetical protein
METFDRGSHARCEGMEGRITYRYVALLVNRQPGDRQRRVAFTKVHLLVVCSRST